MSLCKQREWLTITISGVIGICGFPLSLDSGERFFAVLLVLGVGFTPDSMRSGVEGSVDSLHYGGADASALAKGVKVI